MGYVTLGLNSPKPNGDQPHLQSYSRLSLREESLVCLSQEREVEDPGKGRRQEKRER